MEKLAIKTPRTAEGNNSEAISKQLREAFILKRKVIEEIEARSKFNLTHIIESYSQTNSTIDPALPREKQWEEFEANLDLTSNPPKPNTSNAEQERVRNARVRSEIFQAYGFKSLHGIFKPANSLAIPPEKPEEFQTEQVTFQIIKSPLNSNVFLVKTTTLNKKLPHVLSENLVIAPDMTKAKLHWEKQMIKRFPITASTSNKVVIFQAR